MSPPSWTSDLSVGAFAGLRGVGLEPLGQVMGATVDQFINAGFGSCGGYTPVPRTSTYTATGMPVRTGPVAGTGATSSSPWVGYRNRVQALYAARRRAVQRLVEACTALGGDGVVGVQLSLGTYQGDPRTLECSLVGTAVRAEGRQRPARPFLTDLPGHDVATLLRSGWVPCGLAFGAAVGVKHDDLGSQRLARSWRNGEVASRTVLVQEVRAEVRRQISASVAQHGGSTMVMSRPMSLTVTEQECRQYAGGQDHVAEALLIATALVAFPTRSKTLAQPALSPDRAAARRATRRRHHHTPVPTGEALVNEDTTALSEDAMRRLAELKPGKAGGLFTSDLSVNEFLLVKEAGFSPLGLVLGTSIYHVGLQIGRWSKNQELDVLSQAMYHARELAMARMEAEADVLGADGIVGVRLEVEFKEWGNDVAEFLAVGTAIKADADNPFGSRWRNNRGKPFTSDLSGQDFYTLVRTGYAPLGLTMGTCVYHVAHRSLGNVLGNIGQNVELPQFTQALYDARELAMARMQAEAEALGAEGIVGVQLHQRNHTWGSHTTEFIALGTAVRPLRDDHVIERPQLVLGLDT